MEWRGETSIERPTVVWIDFRGDIPASELKALEAHCELHRENRLAAIAGALRRHVPDVLCFDFDDPRPWQLRALQQVRLTCPLLPTLMLTERSSEALAIWALRTGVRDYIVRPLQVEDLAGRIRRCAAAPSWDGPIGALEPIPLASVFPAPRSLGSAHTASPTWPAVEHVEAHFCEKIPLDTVAHLCGMSRFEFSRAFKRDHGLPFRDFVVRYRIERGQELLKDPWIPVAEVSKAVGFCDVTHFSRMFRRVVGESPTTYRRQDEQDNGVRSGATALRSLLATLGATLGEFLVEVEAEVMGIATLFGVA